VLTVPANAFTPRLPPEFQGLFAGGIAAEGDFETAVLVVGRDGAQDLLV
jgi:hypothetical protein